MIHHNQMHPMTVVSQPPPQHPQQGMSQQNSQRMNHHQYQQRLSHQQIQQQQQQQQHHGGGRNLNGINQHQGPPPIIQKQHLHQNIATLNQKPPHGQSHSQSIPSSTQNSQIQSQRLSYEKPLQPNTINNLKRESNTISVQHSATATLPQNNSSIITGPQQLGPHHQRHHALQNQYQNHHSQQQHDVPLSMDVTKIPVVSANKENIPLNNGISSGGTSTEIILSNNESTEQGIESLANAKEKTPMCLVNELARFNKILHQYRLVKESGPAHKKRFTVVLKLGDEEYAAEDLSIKKAQHAAAKDAIMKTAYKHPPFKKNRQIKGVQPIGKGNSGNITPTVELNALAMKRGEPTTYTVISMTPSNPMGTNPFAQPPPSFRGSSSFRGKFMSQRGGGAISSRFNPQFNGTEIFQATLTVGTRVFTGTGPTQQAARHDAAARALEILKPLTSDSECTKLSTSFGSTCNSESGGDDSLISDIKSPISIVHEMALKRKLTVAFEVQSEKGPPHMKVYTTLCKVGTLVTEGEGNGKKLSKKKAAEKMMDELKKLPPVSPPSPPSRANQGRGRRKQQEQQLQQQQQQQLPVVKKKSRNLIKEKLEQSAIADEINPISQLIQIQQARKEKEPIYTVIDERGTPRRREFVIEVSAGGMTSTGTGPNKKIAKKIAAENLLITMGVMQAPVVSAESPPKERQRSDRGDRSERGDRSDRSDGEKNRKVSFNDADKKSKSTNPRQIVPGILLVSSSESFTTPTTKPTPTTSQATTVAAKEPTEQPQQAAEKPSSPHSNNSSNNDSGIAESGVSPRDQLNYLAQLMGFTVSYADFPKGNHTEFLTLVTLSTEPPQMSHGNGSSRDESRDHAALKALTALSELGLDNVKPKGSSK